MIMFVSAYLVDVKEVSSAVGAGGGEWLDQLRGVVETQRSAVGDEQLGERVLEAAGLLLEGRLEEAARHPYGADALEAICQAVGEKLPTGPFAGCHDSLLDECGPAGERLFSRGCPIQELASRAEEEWPMGFVLASEAEELAADITRRMDEAPDQIDSDVMGAWETLEEWLERATDQGKDVVAFIH